MFTQRCNGSRSDSTIFSLQMTQHKVEFVEFLEGHVLGLNSTHSTRFVQNKLNLKKLGDLKKLNIQTGVLNCTDSCTPSVRNGHVNNFNVSKPSTLFDDLNISERIQ
ncbi:Hypothetical_protein [Hexamita inflata]|uniref:Hypothetical_protein n=1 Tax=Hexamita inflata TaxID=28002 RepID=A0ABP1H6M5_9EUKA